MFSLSLPTRVSPALPTHDEVNTRVSSRLIKLTTFFRDVELWSALDKERLKA